MEMMCIDSYRPVVDLAELDLPTGDPKDSIFIRKHDPPLDPWLSYSLVTILFLSVLWKTVKVECSKVGTV